MNESYIVDRLFVKLVKVACDSLGAACVFYSDDWVAHIKKDNRSRLVFGYNFDLNTAAATAVASDKVATYQLLDTHAIPSVEHYLFRSRASSEVMMHNAAMISDDKKVVIKPLAGTSGHGVHLLSTKHDAHEYVSMQTHSDWAISPFYEIESEKRVILLDGEVLLCYGKVQPDTEDGMRHFNLAKGARAVDCELTSEEKKLAQEASDVLGLRFAVVDIVTQTSGEQRIMEVNTGLMMEYYARQSQTNYDTAQEIYTKLIETMLR